MTAMTHYRTQSGRTRKRLYWLIPAVLLLLMFLGYRALTTRRYVQLRSTSPDGAHTLIARVVERTAFPLPPEPPQVRVRHYTLKLYRGHRLLATSDPVQVGYDPGTDHYVDALWSDDSQILACRVANELFIIEPGIPTFRSYAPVTAPNFISSFRWIAPNTLVLLTKTVNDRSPFKYRFYCDDAAAADLWILDTTTGGVEHVEHFALTETDEVMFLFRSPAFQMDELSSFGPHVLVWDGKKAHAYDYLSRHKLREFTVEPIKVIEYDLKWREPREFTVDRGVDGVWWVDHDSCVVTIGVLGGPEEARFLRLTISTGNVEDVTTHLRPRWKRSYDDLLWYQGALP